MSVRPSVRRLVVAAAAATWFLRQNYAAAAAARRPGEFMNGRSLLTDRASITLSLMARDGGRARAGEGRRREGREVGETWTHFVPTRAAPTDRLRHAAIHRVTRMCVCVHARVRSAEIIRRGVRRESL